MILAMNNENIDKIRHSLAHLLANVVKGKHPDAKLGIGPVVENGFYYDIEFTGEHKPSVDCLPKLEKMIKELIAQDIEFEKKEIGVDEAREIFKDEPYKLELIKELEEEGEKISIYQSGSLIDLCAGPHVKSTKEINPDAFKLTKIAGAYWRGNEENQMLTRIYGIAFETEKELTNYLELMEEAEKRDHRKLGKELDLFTFSNLVGTGLPMFTPKGTIIRTELQNTLFEISKKYNMMPVTIPHIAKRKLYETSGHADKFSDELIKVISHYDEFVMKPVNCPHHTQIYNSKPRSYKDLPLGYMESTMMYRDEKPGELGGLTRVRSITVDDGHIFCTTDQIKDEAKNIAKTIEEFYKKLGMFGDHWVSLSVRDSKDLGNYIGEPKDWDKAEQMLQEISDDLKLNAKRVEGEAAIYGPKLDYMFKDALGRETQLATIQLDFAMPKRFELTYTDKDGKDKTPVMIHRAILGSYERFMAILIEHFAGEFPLWLSPVQAIIIPVSEKFNDYGNKVLSELKENNIRVEIDTSDETLGKRIRSAELQKVPYVLVVGEKEMNANSVAVRSREDGDQGAIPLKDFVEKIK